MRPRRLLDACCRKGGAAAGYIRAGFEVDGVDVEDHGDAYPGRFIQGDAIEFIREHGKDYDAIHISSPCQANIPITAGNRGRKGWEDNHVDLLPAFRAVTRRHVWGWTPVVMENGPSPKIRKDIVLCGETFGLGVIRHRAFEVNTPTGVLVQPTHQKHRGRVRGWRHGEYFDGPYVAVYGQGGGKATVLEAQVAMGIPWMDKIEDLNEAIPPAYTEWIGARLLAYLKEGQACL